MNDRLLVSGAREHNLKDVSLELPRDRLIVFTGLSGSGKSSLAFDTIFAEGQRRYVESLSSYARQFLGQMDKPHVDFIEGLSPAVSIDQKGTNRNPRSTVGTITEVHDYLRLLFARAGTQTCPTCGEVVTAQTAQQIVDRLTGLPEGTRFQLLAPIMRGRKGEHVELLAELQQKGFARAKVDGTVVSLAQPPVLEKKLKHSIDVVVDRLVVRDGVRQRFTDSVETALALAEGQVVAELIDLAPDDPDRLIRFSEKRACPNQHPLALSEIEPRTFSFNAPYGACPECDGIGTSVEVDPELVVPNEDLSLAEGAIAVWPGEKSQYYFRLIAALAEDLKFSTDVPWRALPERAREALLHGNDYQVHVKYKNRWGRERSYTSGFEGAIHYINRKHRETESDSSRERYQGFMREIPCAACHGARLRPEVLAVKVGGLSIAEVSDLSIDRAKQFLDRVQLTEREAAIAAQVLKEIHARLGFLLDVGLDYLTLSRSAGTLSGGEAQRIRLATQIGSGLVGVLYVLDEPSIGLHQRDNRRLIETLTRLRDLGNTLIVVEHDEDTIRSSDWVVDIGPGAASTAARSSTPGSYADLLGAPNSITGDYWCGAPPDPGARRSSSLRSRTAADGSHARGAQPRRTSPQFPLLRRRDRGVRLRQVHPRELRALQRPGQGAEPLAGGPRPPQVDHRHGPPGQGRPRGPVADRAHAAVQSRDLHGGLGPHAPAVRRDDRGEGARVRTRAILVQRQGWPLRGLQGRRHHQDRDELPA